MIYHFYNSFNLGAGYCHADYIGGKPVMTQRELPHELKMDYMNGDCVMALRSCDDIAYLLVKKILYVNKNKTHVEQGRTVNINFSIETSANEILKLSMICKGILAEWNNFCRRLGDIITIPAVDRNDFNYSIDPIQLNGLFSYMEEVGRKAHLASPKLDATLDNPKKGAAILLVPIGDEKRYTKNAENLRLPSEGRKPSVHWTCVLPASKNENDPAMFEKLTRMPLTDDYDIFLQQVSEHTAGHNHNKDQSTQQVDPISIQETEENEKEPLNRTAELSVSQASHPEQEDNETIHSDSEEMVTKGVEKTESLSSTELQVMPPAPHPVPQSRRLKPMVVKLIYALAGFVLGFVVANIIHNMCNS